MASMRPPEGAPAPVAVGIGGRLYEPGRKGAWEIAHPGDADDLARHGWTVVPAPPPDPAPAPPATGEGA